MPLCKCPARSLSIPSVFWSHLKKGQAQILGYQGLHSSSALLISPGGLSLTKASLIYLGPFFLG